MANWHVAARSADHGTVLKWIKEVAPVEQPGRESAFSAYQQAMRDRLLAAPVVPAPEPWRPVFEYEYGVPVGGLLGIGFATHPDSGHDLVMVVSRDGHGLFDAVTGRKSPGIATRTRMSTLLTRPPTCLALGWVRSPAAGCA